MKKLIIIILLVNFCFAQESLNKIYDRYKMAETIEIYKKANESMEILTPQQFAQSGIKDDYPNYGAYRAAMVISINVTKQAIRVKLALMRTKLVGSDKYNSSEKSLYDGEIVSAINKDIK